jgi:hypothetical protein
VGVGSVADTLEEDTVSIIKVEILGCVVGVPQDW